MEVQAQRWMRPEDWLETVRREYLHGFIQLGGAAVKVLVAVEDDDRAGLISSLRRLAGEDGYVFAAVDAAETRVHLLDKVFHALAGQVPWGELARAFLRRILEENGLSLPAEPAELNLAEVARLNDQYEPLLRRDINRWLLKSLFRDYRMCQEFRFAMIGLCMAELDPHAQPPGDVIEAWLRGELRLISSLKQALIFQKIGRHNARHMLLSLTHWLRMAAKAGLVLALDVSRYMVPKQPREPDGSFYYSRAATLDAYEVIRQFIDGTDDLEGCFITVLSTPELLVSPSRGLDAYDALKMRVADEVHDRRRPNPLSSLIRVAPAGEPPGHAGSEGGEEL